MEVLEDRALLSAGSLGALPVVGTLPQNVLVADFNNDGLLDLAITHPDTGTVSIHLGLGEGTFADEMRYLVGISANHLTATDLNGDSLLDLAVTNLTTSEVVVLLGRGDGTFLPGSVSRGQDADPLAGAGGQLVADSSSPAPSFASGQETLSPPTDFAPGWEGQVRGSGALPSSTGLTGGPSVNVPGVGDGASGEGTSAIPGAEGPLTFAPLPLATSAPLSWESRGQVPELLPLRDSTLAVVGTLLSVRQEGSAATKETTLPAPPGENMPGDERPGAALSAFVSGQEEALENRPPLTREELLGPAQQPSAAPCPNSSAGLDDSESFVPEEGAGADSEASFNAPNLGPMLATPLVTAVLASNLFRTVGEALTRRANRLRLRGLAR